MIIFGTRGLTLTGTSGVFNCPNCGGENPYNERIVRRFFTLYWIPLIPLNRLGDFIECKSCKHAYEQDVLEYNPQGENEAFEAEYEKAMRKSMAIMVLADGKVDDSEVSAMTQIYNSTTGKELSEIAVRNEIEEVRKEGLTINAYLKSINGFVNDAGKEMIVKALLLIAYADGDFDEEEKNTLAEALAEMDISKSHFEQIIANMNSG
jgi:uncharacterized tellurite resistance protein B-like protein